VRSSDSELARALLPLPSGGTSDHEPAVWQLRYARPDVDPAWLTSVGRELDTDISVLAGLIETIDDGGAAGRVTVRIERPLAAEVVRDAFAARGIHATQARNARAGEVEPEEVQPEEFDPGEPVGAIVRSAA
jgi:D-methionine transport system ATP-binding protein